MGLDMYLSKRTYVKHSDFKGEDNFTIKVMKNGVDYKFIEPKSISYLVSELMYWRKANAIHSWFVKNVQNGEDDCGTYSVSLEQLEELLAACKSEIDTKGESNALTPTSGFFFGSIEKDEWYFEALSDTIEVLEKEIKEQNENKLYDEYEYSSSW